MSAINPWNVTDVFSEELVLDDGKWFFKDRILCEKTVAALSLAFPAIFTGVTGAELEIFWRSKGYHDPGCWYLRNGDPGYPPEGEDIRTIEKMTIDGKELSGDLRKMIEDDVGEEVMEKLLKDQDLPECDDEEEGPEYDPDE